MLITFLSIALAALLGFAAHRASICTVRAVAELMSTGSAHMLISFAKSVLWVLAITIPVLWFVPEVQRGQAGWAMSTLSVVGGGIYGVGAAINGGCAFSTLSQLADGKLRMLGTIVGFSVGIALVFTFAHIGDLSRPVVVHIDWLFQSPISIVIAASLVLWCCYEARYIWVTRSHGMKLTELLFAKRYRLSTAASLIGLSNAVLYLMYGSWSYTGTLQQSIEGALSVGDWPWGVRWLLFAALIGGMLFSTLQRGNFSLEWRPASPWLMNVVGGVLMGIGAVLIPGGNDVLVLHGIPSFSPNALPAYFAMLLGIAIVLVAMRVLFKMAMRVECSGDVCVSSDRP